MAIEIEQVDSRFFSLNGIYKSRIYGIFSYGTSIMLKSIFNGDPLVAWASLDQWIINGETYDPEEINDALNDLTGIVGPGGGVPTDFAVQGFVNAGVIEDWARINMVPLESISINMRWLNDASFAAVSNSRVGLQYPSNRIYTLLADNSVVRMIWSDGPTAVDCPYDPFNFHTYTFEGLNSGTIACSYDGEFIGNLVEEQPVDELRTGSFPITSFLNSDVLQALFTSNVQVRFVTIDGVDFEMNEGSGDTLFQEDYNLDPKGVKGLASGSIIEDYGFTNVVPNNFIEFELKWDTVPLAQTLAVGHLFDNPGPDSPFYQFGVIKTATQNRIEVRWGLNTESIIINGRYDQYNTYRIEGIGTSNISVFFNGEFQGSLVEREFLSSLTNFYAFLGYDRLGDFSNSFIGNPSVRNLNIDGIVFPLTEGLGDTINGTRHNLLINAPTALPTQYIDIGPKSSNSVSRILVRFKVNVLSGGNITAPLGFAETNNFLYLGIQAGSTIFNWGGPFLNGNPYVLGTWITLSMVRVGNFIICAEDGVVVGNFTGTLSGITKEFFIGAINRESAESPQDCEIEYVTIDDETWVFQEGSGNFTTSTEGITYNLIGNNSDDMWDTINETGTLVSSVDVDRMWIFPNSNTGTLTSSVDVNRMWKTIPIT